MNASKRAGYSTPRDTLKVLSPLASSKLTKGAKVTASLLEDVGISSSDSYEVRIAMRHLGWVDDQDCITETYEHLAHTTGAEYRAQLRANVQEKYADILDRRINPTQATLQEMKDAFRDCDYEPANMRSKMVALFKGLCREAGIISQERETPQATGEQSNDTPSSMPLLTDVPLAPDEDTSMADSLQSKANAAIHASSFDSLIAELIDTLSQLAKRRKSANWTEADRVIWVKYLKMNFALLEKHLTEGDEQ